MSSFFSKVIAVEGLDASGKGTQVRLLQEKFHENNIRCFHVDYPNYSSFYGKMIAEYLRGEMGSIENTDPRLISLLYALDRLEDKEDIDRAVKKGEVILCNRYVYSNAAFQSVKLPKEKRREFVEWIEDLEFNRLGLAKPDIVIYLRSPLVEVKKKIEERGLREYQQGKVDIHEDNYDYLTEVAYEYERLAQEKNWIVIDQMDDQGNRLPKEIISERIFTNLMKVL